MPIFSPNHTQLIKACYPPSSALLTSGPDYRPNAHELSRLTYYAANGPGKLTKLGAELLKRTKHDCNRAQASNMRSRSSLLITLNIFKAVANECRRDLTLLSPSLVASVAVAMNALSSDLEVAEKAVNLFTTWTTFTNGHLIGVDSSVTENYLSVLRAFSRLSCVESKSEDHEMRNRARLVGSYALKGAVNSEALYHNPSHYRIQVAEIVRPLLVTILEVPISTLESQNLYFKHNQNPPSPFLAEFRSRPAIERRAISLHIHIDGENGPSTSDVANACLQIFFSLFQHSNGAQIGHVMKSGLDALGGLSGWDKLGHCCWFAQKACEWSQYQYRYAVPTCLVERLLEKQDAPTAASEICALVTMVTTVFSSPTPLINLSTSDIINNLITVLLRHVSIDPGDPLLPALVECIASLGAHVYYSDQIQDLAGELISRLTIIELHGLVPGKHRHDKSRSQAIRCLLSALIQLIFAASKDEPPTKGPERSWILEQTATPSAAMTSFASSTDGTHMRLPRRTRISPDAWQETLSLLCDQDYSIRADYAEALVSYLRSEIRQKGDATAANGVRPARSLADGPIRQAKNLTLILYGDSTTRFLNAMYAYVYVLATATSLGLTSRPPSPTKYHASFVPAVNIQPATPYDSAFSAPPNARKTPSSPALSSHTHKSSLVQNLLAYAPAVVSSAASACASDHSHILAILTAAHERLPIRALLTGVPMLLALNSAVKFHLADDLPTWQRMRTIKELLARTWAVIARVWNLSRLAEMAAEAISSMPGDSHLPSIQPFENRKLHPPREPIPFPESKDLPVSSWSGVDAEEALSTIASSQTIQEATALDKESLLRRLSVIWTPDSALKDSTERPSKFDSIRGDGVSPLLRISPALTQGENVSLQSLARSSRGVGVTDLREALEGRCGMSNPALGAPPSISTLERVSSITGSESPLTRHKTVSSVSSRQRTTTSPNGEVRDVLSRLGIGKQNGNSLLKASFPSLPKASSRPTSMLAPPYSA